MNPYAKNIAFKINYFTVRNGGSFLRIGASGSKKSLLKANVRIGVEITCLALCSMNSSRALLSANDRVRTGDIPIAEIRTFKINRSIRSLTSLVHGTHLVSLLVY